MAKSSSGRSAAGWDGRFVVVACVAPADDFDVAGAELNLLLGFTAVAVAEGAPKPPPLPPPPAPLLDEPLFFFFAGLPLLPFPLAAPRAVEEFGRAYVGTPTSKLLPLVGRAGIAMKEGSRARNVLHPSSCFR